MLIIFFPFRAVLPTVLGVQGVGPADNVSTDLLFHRLILYLLVHIFIASDTFGWWLGVDRF